MKRETVTTDVLCVGGGIAGLMAARHAREMGAKTLLVEKGATRYSGLGRIGNDHFWCRIPEVHGPDSDFFIKECMLTQLGTMIAPLGRTIIRTWVEKSFEMVKLWESWGIEMKHDGKWELSGHSFPGRIMTHLKYKGHNQKRILTDEALKRGVEVMDRVMVFDLLTEPEGVVGALGIDTRDDRLIQFNAKSVILSTGTLTRIFPGATPAVMGNNSWSFTMTGDGRAMAYRAGAELFNMEMLVRQAGVKNYCRSGQGTWAGVCRDPEGRPVGKYSAQADARHSDMIIEVDKQIFERYSRSGRGPIHMDCTSLTEEGMEYLLKGLMNEGNVGLLTHLEENGIDLRRHQLEFGTYELRSAGRITMNGRAQTTIPGLFAAGDETTGTISGACTFGWIGGEGAALYAKNHTPSEPDRHKIEEMASSVDALQKRQHGFDWRDANLALQHTLSDYAGLIRSQSMLEAGLAHLRRLKTKVQEELKAANRWELTRCLEVTNLYDLGELVFLSALERKESRGMHQRADYPYIDPLLNDQLLTIRRVDEKPLLSWRDIPK
jgi:succinate dehydrogenase/fumarate reductase flavoprotein subunit